MAEDLTLENVLATKLDVKAARFGANREALRVLMVALRAEEDEIRLGGGAKAAEAQRAKGRLTVRERLKLLLDPVDSSDLKTQVSESRPGAPGGMTNKRASNCRPRLVVVLRGQGELFLFSEEKAPGFSIR